MVHGGYEKRRASAASRRPKGLGVEKRPKSVKNNNKKNKPIKTVSLKNQIRSTERMLRKNLPAEIKEAQEKKLEELKKEQDTQTRLAIQRKIFLRDRKIRFFERRKVERMIRRLEKLQRSSAEHNQEANVSDQLSRLKEDLEYVRFFPKTEKYLSLFSGDDDAEIVEKRNKLRHQIKAKIVAAAASGKDLEETGSEDDGVLDMSEDDFFLTGSSSDEADADDEWTDKSTSCCREQASSASGKAASGMSSDEKNQRQVSARALMPPPRPSSNSARGQGRNQTRFDKKPSFERNYLPTSRNTSRSRSDSSFQNRGSLNTRSGHSSNPSNYLPTSRNTSRVRSDSSFQNHGSSNTRSGHSSNLSSNSDAHKPRRKRRPKKKKQQT